MNITFRGIGYTPNDEDRAFLDKKLQKIGFAEDYLQDLDVAVRDSGLLLISSRRNQLREIRRRTIGVIAQKVDYTYLMVLREARSLIQQRS